MCFCATLLGFILRHWGWFCGSFYWPLIGRWCCVANLSICVVTIWQQFGINSLFDFHHSCAGSRGLSRNSIMRWIRSTRSRRSSWRISLFSFRDVCSFGLHTPQRRQVREARLRRIIRVVGGGHRWCVLRHPVSLWVRIGVFWGVGTRPGCVVFTPC